MCGYIVKPLACLSLSASAATCHTNFRSLGVSPQLPPSVSFFLSAGRRGQPLFLPLSFFRQGCGRRGTPLARAPVGAPSLSVSLSGDFNAQLLGSLVARWPQPAALSLHTSALGSVASPSRGVGRSGASSGCSGFKGALLGRQI